MPNARLKWYDKPVGKVAQRVLWFRPFTKPTGLIPRLLMYWHRITFRWK